MSTPDSLEVQLLAVVHPGGQPTPGYADPPESQDDTSPSRGGPAFLTTTQEEAHATLAIVESTAAEIATFKGTFNIVRQKKEKKSQLKKVYRHSKHTY